MRIMTLVVLLAMLTVPVAAAAGEYVPRYDRIRAALDKERVVMTGETSGVTLVPVRRQPHAIVSRKRDSVWSGVLIGLGAGAGSGYLWARNVCGSSDDECFAIARPAGLIGGAAIGALVGGLLDYFSN